MFRFSWLIVGLVSIACGPSSSGNPDGGNSLAPSITSFSPSSGAVGSEVHIQGLRFGATPAGNTVQFNGVTATVLNAAATELVVQVPAGATNGTLKVTTSIGSAESAGSFTVLINTIPGESFTTRLLGPGSSTTGLAWNGTRFTSVGGGETLSSTDGLAWSVVQSLSNQTDVAWDGNRFVSVGSFGSIEVSANGLSWSRIFTTSHDDLFAVVGSGTKWVVVGDNGSILSSPDGTTWTSRGSAGLTTQRLNAVAWTGNQFVAVGNAGIVLTSPDGVSWTSRSAPTGNNLTAVAASSTVITVAASNAIFTSPNGGTWTPRGTYSGVFNRMLYAGGRFVAAGFYLSATSPDGTSWTESGTILGVLDSIAFTGSQYVALGPNTMSAGTVFSSSDGLNWFTRVVTQNLVSIARSPVDGRLVAAGGSIASQTSMDGIAWEFGASSASVSQNNPFTDVVWSTSAGGFIGLVQIAANQYGYKSTDGKTWNQLAYAPCQGRLAASDALMVNVGTSLSGACLSTSTDGVTWTSRTVPAGQSLRHAFWTGNQFVAVGPNGAIATSPDGITWTPQTTSVTTALNGVAASPSMLVVVGDGGKILSSSNGGTTWDSRTSGTSYSLNAALWTGAQFYAVGGGGTVLRSSDGISWTAKTTPYLISINDILWLPALNRLVLVGEQGLTATSP